MKNVQTIEHTPIAVIDYNVTDAALAELKKEYTGLTVASNKERAVVQSGITELTSLRTSVEKKRKELKADALEFGRKVDGEAKRITGLIEAIEQPLKDAKQAYDDEQERIKAELAAKEQARIDAIMARIDSIKNRTIEMVGKSSEEIGECHLQLTDEMVMGDGFDYQEFKDQARKAQSETMERLASMQIERQKHEAELAAQAEREKEAEAARIKLAAEQAELAAKQKAFVDQQAAAQREADARDAAVRKAAADAEYAAKQKELEQQREENKRITEIEDKRLAVERREFELAKEKAAHEAKLKANEDMKRDLVYAAAPDMLAALELAHPFVTDDKARTAVGKAICKARGETA